MCSLAEVKSVDSQSCHFLAYSVVNQVAAFAVWNHLWSSRVSTQIPRLKALMCARVALPRWQRRVTGRSTVSIVRETELTEPVKSWLGEICEILRWFGIV